MEHLRNDDILTRVNRYNLIRDGRMLYIDIHHTLHGRLAAPYVAVPNLINIVARQPFQGIGDSEEAALSDCLEKIRRARVEDLFPQRPPTSD
jgi:hypothetical protein